MKFKAYKVKLTIANYNTEASLECVTTESMTPKNISKYVEKAVVELLEDSAVFSDLSIQEDLKDNPICSLNIKVTESEFDFSEEEEDSGYAC